VRMQRIGLQLKVVGEHLSVSMQISDADPPA
jgi:hypothetical protein